ncbi:AraC family transcriptional regulator [Nonomuraea longispora]|uniref:AraC family transcriptional regulator n=1 Tax=Nonomuraea longispora TaxID=1848320 RepID=A0A4V2XKS1_9ACTN|nr:DJ-1/PfpI family protein [Nonomuraea longispora]TDC07616.1 AraC family transcriptional regulator [Nonomuraea longispora]
MTNHERRPGGVRTAARLVWHYFELVIAAGLGMMLLDPLWVSVLEVARFDLYILLMAAGMAAGVALWMLVRRHARPRIAEMSLAVFLPFPVLLVPFWLGALPAASVTLIGHVIPMVLLAAAMIWRRAEYADPRHRFRFRSGWWRGTAIVLAALLLPGAVSAVNTTGKFGDLYTAPANATTAAPAPKTHDPAKPTVALLVGGGGTNVADLLGPYEVLAGTGRVNTYVVSSGSRLAPLTGGLDLVPDLTFPELARLLDEQDDTLDAVIVPALQDPGPAELGSITRWLREQSAAGALTMSVCTGARTLAASGLLDGRTATSHWLRMAGLRDDFPRVGWVTGVRYVDDGDIISTAGVLSGVEGALRMLERLVDPGSAREAARRVHWPHYSPGAAVRIAESRLQPPDLVVALNASYNPGPSSIGVRVAGGIGELELASVFISYTEHAMVGRTVALGDGPFRSRHGLTFVPRSTVAAAADGLDRLLVPGVDAARARAADGVAGLRPEFLHTEEEFAFDPVLRDIARTYDVQTALWTAKTMEYPVSHVGLGGSAWPWPATLVLLVLVLLGGAAAVVAPLAFRRIRTSH